MVVSKPVIPDEISEEQENYMRLQLLRGLIQKILRQEFHKHFDMRPGVLYHQLKAYEKEIDKLLQKKIIGREQYNLLLPQSGLVYSEKFDVSLLVILLRNLCGYGYTKNWKPNENDRSIKANIYRCIDIRNKIQHSPTTVMKKDMYDVFDLVEQPLLELGATKKEIDGLKAMKIVDKETKRKIKESEEFDKKFHYGWQPPVENFSKRDDELHKLHQSMKDSVDEKDFTNNKLGVVVCGMGGVGKSQLARQYWKINQGNFYSDHCIWINGESKENMENDFQTIGEQCGLKNIKNPDGTFKELAQVVYWVY